MTNPLPCPQRRVTTVLQAAGAGTCLDQRHICLVATHQALIGTSKLPLPHIEKPAGLDNPFPGLTFSW